MERYLFHKIKTDLNNYRKIAMISGPRQVGKTTMALKLIAPDADESHPAYLNWDDEADRNKILDNDFPEKEKLLVLDEIHKNPDWRGLLKGLWDKQKSKRLFVVTGSARLDHYRHGGDSLMGRYLFYRLHPLSPGELKVQDSWARLVDFSGFPEPFFLNDTDFLKRWQNMRKKRVLEEDLISLERVIEVNKIGLLMSLLPRRVGSLLSLRSLGEDLSVSHSTVERWITVLENLYYCYRISPWGSGELAKALKKDQKLYLWDWSTVPDQGAKFENLVGSMLLKYIHMQEDLKGDIFRLHFIRSRDNREIDFVVCNETAEPIFAVECKYGSKDLSPHIEYFADRTSIPLFYQVHNQKVESRERLDGKALVMNFQDFCKKLGL